MAYLRRRSAFWLHRRLLQPRLTSRSGSTPSPFRAQGEISPGKNALLHCTTAGSTSLPLDHESFAVIGPLALVGNAFYPVLVHRPAASLHASSPHSVALMRPCWAHQRKRPPGCPDGLSFLTVATHWRAISVRLHRGPISQPCPDRWPLLAGAVANWSPTPTRWVCHLRKMPLLSRENADGARRRARMSPLIPLFTTPVGLSRA